MGDLWVKLHPIPLPRFIDHCGNGCTLGTGSDSKALRHRDHLIAVAHPHIKLGLARVSDMIFDLRKQTIILLHIYPRITKLALLRGADLTAQLSRHSLHAIADP